MEISFSKITNFSGKLKELKFYQVDHDYVLSASSAYTSPLKKS